MADTAAAQLPGWRRLRHAAARRLRPAAPARPVPAARARAGRASRWCCLWPLAQVVLYSFQNYGLPQLTGAAPVQWVGLANFTTTFADPEFWLSLRITVLFAAVVVPLTLVTGTRGRPAAEPPRPQDVGVRVHRGAAGLGHSPGLGQRAVLLAVQPGRRPGRLDPEQDAALAGRQHRLGRLQLDHHRRAAGLHGADHAGGLAVVPVHRGHRAGRAQDRPGRAVRGRAGGRRERRGGCSGGSPTRC